MRLSGLRPPSGSRLPPVRRVALVVALVVAGLGAVTGGAEAQPVRFGRNRVPVGEATRWVFVQTPRYDVYAPRGYEALARTAAREAETVTPRLERLTGHRLERRVPVLVFPSAAAFGATNAVPLPEDIEGIGGVTDRAKNRVLVPFLGDRAAFARVLAHELTHAYLNDLYGRGALLRPTRARMPPLWFLEGLAEYVAAVATDGRPTPADERVLRAAVLAGGLPRLDRLRGWMAYRGGHAVWAFVAAEYGEQRIAELVQAFAATRRVDVSLGAVTGLSMGEFDDRWRAAWQDVLAPEAAFRLRLDEMGRTVPLAPDADPVSVALSPDGNRVAVALLGRTDASIAVVQLADGARLWTALTTRASAAVTRLRLGSGGLAWSPDGRRLAVAASDARGDYVAVLDAASGASVRTVRPRVDGRALDGVLALAWSPDGTAIALSGLRRGQSDLFRLDVGTGAVTDLTDDPASDLTPAWTRDGAALVFVTDRADAATLRGGSDLDRPSTLARLDIATRTVAPLPVASPRPGAPAVAGADVLYVDDARGVANLVRLAPDGRATPLTNLLVGIDGGLTVSADGSRALVTSLDGGRPALVLLRAPLALPETAVPLSLAAGGTAAPVYTATSPERRALNPFLRRAEGRPDATANTATAGAADPDRPVDPDRTVDPDPSVDASSPERPTPDTTGLGALLAAAIADGPEPARYVPERARGAEGELRARPYRLLFSADALSGTAGLDALYGVQAVAQVQASDLLGNHVLTAASNLLLDLRNSDYSLGYTYRPRRVDLSATLFQTARLVPDDADGVSLTRYRYVGVSGGASLPLDVLRRVDATVTLAAVSQASVFEPAQAGLSRRLLLPALTYTVDRSIGIAGPAGAPTATDGVRASLTATGSPFGSARFVSLVADGRAYRSLLGEAVVVALRASGGASVGTRPQRFYGAGVSGWVDPSFDTDAFPIVQLEDFAFATPVLPLRGHRIGARSGPVHALVNAEVRVPLIAVVGSPPGPVLPLAGVAFADVATFAGADNGRYRILTGGRPRRFEDVLAGVGVGLRTSALGLPLRADLGWPFDGATIGQPLLHLSLGLDF